ncbi:MAG: phytanoyl-CoA dioxygenase family protein [Planctomycetes bacterium]|nr:phytanoyl-CoA dioxygenase family protein [Planctomycetota bacterium]
MLTEQEVGQFWEDGYLVINDILSTDELEEMRAAAADPGVIRGLKDRGADEHCVHFLEITAKHEAFKKLARHPGITGRLAKLIGADIQLQHSKLATKPAKKGAGAFGWHQDFAYFPHTNTDLVAVMVMLDDATPENGGMYAVQGSHKLGLLNHIRDGYFAGSCMEPKHWEGQPEKVVPLMARAGGISLHHAYTLHGSPPNRSGAPRRGIVFQYRADDAYQLADHVWVDTGYQVLGQNRGQVRCENMKVILPKFRGRVNELGQCFGNVYKQIGEYAVRWNKEGVPAEAGKEAALAVK